mgnify:FL=1
MAVIVVVPVTLTETAVGGAGVPLIGVELFLKYLVENVSPTVQITINRLLRSEVGNGL